MTLEEFYQLQSEPGAAVLMMTSATCAPCKGLQPIVTGMCAAVKIPLVMVDAPSSKDLCMKFGIRSTPTLLYKPAGGEAAVVRSVEELLKAIT